MGYDYDLFQSYCDDEVVDAVVEVLERQAWWIKGSEIGELESQMAEVTNRTEAVAVDSGTSALYATLRCLDIENKEVILPSFTYQATPNTIVAAGGKPKFADIERDSFGLDADDVREKITDETAGIIPVHFGGDVATDIRELREIADEHELFLLEDAAHSLGATSRGEPTGSFGDAAAFSFAFNKIVATAQGGMVVTDNEALADAIRQFRVHGRNSQREYVDWGLNLVMSSIHAAIGTVQMDKLETLIERRRYLAKLYDRELSGLKMVTTKSVPSDHQPVYFLYNALLPDTDTRNQLQAYLDEDGIPTQAYYQGCHLTEYYCEEWGYGPGDLPVTEEVADRIITLPFHLNLDEADIEDIASRIRSFFEE
jgi:perosamine synthetase